MLRVEKKVRVSGRDDFLFGPVVGAGKLFLGGHAELICLDATTLEAVWRRSLRCVPTDFSEGCLVVSEQSKVKRDRHLRNWCRALAGTCSTTNTGGAVARVARQAPETRC